jgi:hypothetical protein
MRISTALIGLMTLLGITAACGSGGADATPTSELQNYPAVESTPMKTVSAVQTPLATLEPVINVPTLPPFDIGEFSNSDDIANFMGEVGKEKVLPSELHSTAPELSTNQAAEILREFLADTRVVTVEKTLRETRVKRIEDYCDNGVRITIYLRPGGLSFTDRQLGAAQRYIGLKVLWTVEHSDITAWNEPYIAGSETGNMHISFTRGWDGMGFPQLFPSNQDGYVRLGYDSDEHIRVFDHPNCDDPLPVLEYSPDQWQVLGLGAHKKYPEELRTDQPQLDEETLLALWDETWKNTMSFDNLSGLPFLMMCEDHQAIDVNPYNQTFGEVFSWHLEDGREINTNGVWMAKKSDNRNYAQIAPEYRDLRHIDDPYRQVIILDLPDCSIENGLAYVESIREEYNR